MNDQNFKITLIKALEKEINNIRDPKQDPKQKEDLRTVVFTLPNCNVYLEETSIFTYREWNTYRTILHIHAPINKLDIFESQASIIETIAGKIYGRQGDNYLTDVEIEIMVEQHEIIDFTMISVTSIITQSISDAELFMKEGKYASAFDRVHTAFHGYLRKILDDMEVQHEESETINQLYNKLHNEIECRIEPEPVAGLIKTLIRSASGVISSINDIRNRHSLSHPNEEIIGEREALLAIRIIEELSNYINEVI